MQKCVCVILAKIIGIDSKKNWYYDSCDICLKKIELVYIEYFCEECDALVNATIRYFLFLYY